MRKRARGMPGLVIIWRGQSSRAPGRSENNSTTEFQIEIAGPNAHQAAGTGNGHTVACWTRNDWVRAIGHLRASKLFTPFAEMAQREAAGPTRVRRPLRFRRLGTRFDGRCCRDCGFHVTWTHECRVDHWDECLGRESHTESV